MHTWCPCGSSWTPACWRRPASDQSHFQVGVIPCAVLCGISMDQLKYLPPIKSYTNCGQVRVMIRLQNRNRSCPGTDITITVVRSPLFVFIFYWCIFWPIHNYIQHSTFYILMHKLFPRLTLPFQCLPLYTQTPTSSSPSQRDAGGLDILRGSIRLLKAQKLSLERFSSKKFAWALSPRHQLWKFWN